MKLILLIIGVVLLCGNVYANVGYNEINLIDYDTNKFININSTIPLSTHTYNLKSGINWIGMPFNTTISNADELIKSIPNISWGANVKWWNSTSQQVESYSKTPGGYAGINFPVKAARGYEIAVRSNTIWALPACCPISPVINYKVFNLNKYVGTNIIKVRDI